MKTFALIVTAMIAIGTLSGCGSSSTAAATDSAAPAKVSGVSTPKSVSVVTAN